MSNHLAIATVTATLRSTLANVLAADQLGVDPNVTTVRPDALGGDKLKSGVNLYLYQVVSNGAHLNDDLPTRRSDGTLVRRPQMALDLYYLVSFYGNDADLEPQRLMGSVTRALHARPILTRDAILKTLQQSDAPPWLALSDLADQIERVRFTPMLLSLEDMSKIWSVFFQTKYALSMAYAGSVVLLETDDDAIRTPLPVRERTIVVVPSRPPVIDRVRALGSDVEPIVAGATIEILGRELRGDVTKVLVDDVEVATRSVEDHRIVVALPALDAGAHGLQVVHGRQSQEADAALRRDAESNPKAFVLRPTVMAATLTGVSGEGPAPRSGQITVQLAPPVGPTQRVALMLHALSADRASGFRIPVAARANASDRVAGILPSVPAGEYLVRVEVDGVESVLTLDAAGAADASRVRVP